MKIAEIALAQVAHNHGISISEVHKAIESLIRDADLPFQHPLTPVELVQYVVDMLVDSEDS